MKKKQTFLVIILPVFFCLLFSVGNVAKAWDEPDSNPPTQKVSRPLDVGSTAQTKSGGLIITGGVTSTKFCFPDSGCIENWNGASGGYWVSSTNGIYYSGNVGIGTPTVLNSIRLSVAGTVRALSTSSVAVIGTDSLTALPSNKVGLWGHNELSNLGYGVYGTAKTGVGGYFSSASGYGLVVASGKVGIGTSTPDLNLNIYNLTNGPIISLEGPITNNYRGIKIADTSNKEKWFYGARESDFVLRSNNNSDNIIVKNSGSVIVGSSSNPLGFSFTNNPSNIIDFTLYRQSVANNIAVHMALLNPSAVTQAGNGSVFILAEGSDNYWAIAKRTSGGDSDNSKTTANYFQIGYRGVTSDQFFPFFQITPTGNVGIASSTPSKKLTVGGDILASGSICGKDGCVGSGGGGASLWSTTTNNGIYYNKGNVSIGTSTVTDLLTLVGASTFGRVTLRNTNSGGYTAYRQDVGTDNNNFLILRLNGPSVGVEPQKAFLSTNNSLGFKVNSSFDRLTVSSLGNIGIGTSTPSKILHIYNTSSNPEIAIQGQLGNNNHWGIYTRTDVPSTDIKYNSLNFWASGNDRLTILKSGRVGIGTTSPSSLLQMNPKSSVGLKIVSDAINSPLIIRNSTDASDLFRVYQTGVVSISSGKFSINGSGNITKINSVSSSWPSSQGAANSYLKNNGNGFLSWSSIPAGVSGTGTVNYLTKWITNSTVGASTIFDTGSKVGIGTTTPNSLLEIKPPSNVEGLRINSSNFSPFVIQNSSNNDLFRINESGNTTLAGYLRVYSGSSPVKSYLNSSSHNGMMVHSYSDPDSANLGYVDIVARQYSNSSSGGSKIRFFTQSTGNPKVAFTIDQNNNSIVENQIQVKGGNPEAGKVLTASNTSGNATWEKLVELCEVGSWDNNPRYPIIRGSCTIDKTVDEFKLTCPANMYALKAEIYGCYPSSGSKDIERINESTYLFGCSVSYAYVTKAILICVKVD